MIEETERRHGKRRRLGIALAALIAVVLVVLIVPPMVSISRYKNRITRLISMSLGRPVRLSSVELRLLPRPGFVLTDLTVAEDPAYGAEPVLHANTVTASIRLLSLWRGRLEIGRISVDEASLNLVRSGPGRWNLDPLFRTAAANAGSAGNVANSRRAVPFPYLEATDSRINIKNGAEKLPYSLLNTDLELWQENAGDWRIRLRGQPARTDVSLYQEDTGVVRLEASIRRAPALSEMPVHIDLDWREAQLGQLARLVTGSDPGWRGDLTGEAHLDGTADAAHITTRLSATGVHRSEFAPADLLDFDANCSFVYHYSHRALENLVCESPLGDGHIRLTGDLPNEDLPPRFTVELDRISVAAGLDALRTLRNGIAPDLEAQGTVSGKVAYAPTPAPGGAQALQSTSQPTFRSTSQPTKQSMKQSTKKRNQRLAAHALPNPLTGTLTVDGFELDGGGLSHPLQVSKLVLEPAMEGSPAAGHSEALQGTMTIPAGGSAPVSVNLRLALSGYRLGLRGQAGIARVRELVRAAGVANAAGLDSLAGEPMSIDLTVEGPWLRSPQVQPDASDEPPAQSSSGIDTLSGTVSMRDSNWKADYLANHIEIAQATLHLGGGGIRWDPVAFSYGALKGTATLALPSHCKGSARCTPQFQMHFGALDAATVQTAILGVHEQGTLLSSLINRLHSSSAPEWPELQGTIDADSLHLGPVTLREPSATVHVLPTGAEISDFNANVLGGRVQASGTFDRAASDEGQAAYTLDARFQNLSPSAVGQLIELHWSGGALNADAKVSLSGYTDKDLASSAKGTVHFDWRNGAVATPGVQNATAAQDATASIRASSVPAALAHFDRWTAEASVKDGGLTLGKNEVHQGSRERTVAGTLTFGNPPKTTFVPPKESQPETQ